MASERRRVAQRRRRDLKEKAVLYKGGRCEICQYDGSPMAFDFHHLNAQEKDFTISSHLTSWKRIQSELDKCVLLCARCHREVHDGMHPFYLVDESGDTGGGHFDAYDDDIPPELQ